MTRYLSTIAEEIIKDWRNEKEPSKVTGKRLIPNKYAAAFPYVSAMLDLDTISQNYGLDSGKSIVLYFLANAGTWRGETARRVKAELREMVK